MNTYKLKAETPCYVNSSDTCGNPYRLTPCVADDGEIWLEADGNGCADDIVLEDIGGESADYIDEKWGEIDLDALRQGADEIAAAGDEDAADYIRYWIDRCEDARAE